MSDQNKRVTITLGVKGDSADFAKLKNQFSEFGMWLKGSIGLNAGTDLYNGFKRMISEGIRFNGMLEQSHLGIAAILRTFRPNEFNSFDSALEGSKGIVQELDAAAETTAASFEDLVKAYQSIAGAAFAAGVPMSKHVELTKMLAQAVAGFGLPSNQLAQESKALLTGDLQGAQLAKSLGVTKQMIDQARASGRMFEFLQGKLTGFSEAGAYASGTFSVQVSNLKDTLQRLSAEVSQGAFTALKGQIQELSEYISSDQFKEAVSGMASMISGVLGFAQRASDRLGMGFWYLTHPQQAPGVFFAHHDQVSEVTGQSAATTRPRRIAMPLYNGTQLEEIMAGLRAKAFTDMEPILSAVMNVRAPSGLAQSGLYTSFGAAVMAKEGLSLQRSIVRNTAGTLEELIRLRASFAGLL